MDSIPNDRRLNRSLTKERLKLLQNLENALQKPMMLLGVIWLALIVLQFVLGSKAAISDLILAIWIVFVVDFVIRFVLATKKLRFLKRNALMAVSLVLPALRVLQLGQIFAMIPSWQVPLLQMIAGLNRSLIALQSTMERRGLRYVIALTAIVTFAGAAGMYHFERTPNGGGLNSYGGALWWTAMVMTTLGSDYFPHTVPGRVLCFLLAVFAFSIFGYITAAIASYFFNEDANDKRSAIPNENTLVQVLREVKGLREQVDALVKNA
jgi:voltage-gated potassium channel